MRLLMIICLLLPAAVLTFDVDLRKFAPSKNKNVGNGNLKESRRQNYASEAKEFIDFKKALENYYMLEQLLFPHEGNERLGKFSNQQVKERSQKNLNWVNDPGNYALSVPREVQPPPL